MHEVFLSYKAEDRARLKPLVAALESDGCSIWWDAHIGGGSDWREEIQGHLDAARCVIVAWSERSVGPQGSFVRDEASRARKANHYLPVCIDPVDPPLGFGEVQAISLTGWKGNRKDPRYQALLVAVRARLAGEAEPAPLPASLAPPRLSRRVALAGGAGIVALAGAGGWALLGPGGGASSRRIAVLPFANLSGDPAQAYFSDGIAEELRGALSRIGLEVIGRTSSDAVRDLDAKAAAAKLGVAHILTGSVRRSADTIRIGAQLVNGGNGVERWAENYDRAPGDTIKIQTDIASSVAEALSVALGIAAKAALTLGGTSDPLAQDLFLKAENLRLQGDGSEENYKAIGDLLDQAIARDNNYASAYVERSGVLISLAANYTASAADAAAKLAQAEAAARKVVAITPRLGDGYATLSLIAASRLDFAETLTSLKTALKLSPNSTRVLRGAENLVFLGDPDEARAQFTHGIALDPLEVVFLVLRGNANYFDRRYPEAIDDGRRALVVSPERQSPRILIGQSLVEMGRLAEARLAYAELRPDNPLKGAYEAVLAAKSNDRAAATAGIATMQQIGGDSFSYQYAQVYTHLNMIDRAFAALDRAVEVKDPGLIYLKKDPVMDPIRRDPRFAALLKRLKFP